MRTISNFFSNIKKSFYAICMISAASVILFASCQNNEQILNSALDQMNKSLPQQIEQGMSLEKVSLEDRTWVTYTVLVDDEYYDIVEMDQNKESSKAKIISDLRNGDSDVQAFIKICKKLKYGIAYKYIGAYSAYSFTIYIGSSNL